MEGGVARGKCRRGTEFMCREGGEENERGLLGVKIKRKLMWGECGLDRWFCL